MLDMPKISPSSDGEWCEYYKKKYNEADKQLEALAYYYSHLLRFCMNGQHRDAYMLTQIALQRLQYPRDRDPILAELIKHPQHAGSILREEE